MEKHHSEKNLFFLKPSGANKLGVDELMEHIKSFIAKNDCKNLELDLTEFNLIDATQIGVMASTCHFLKFLNGTVRIVVNSEETAKNIRFMNLTNAKITVNSTKQICACIA